MDVITGIFNKSLSQESDSDILKVEKVATVLTLAEKLLGIFLCLIF